MRSRAATWRDVDNISPAPLFQRLVDLDPGEAREPRPLRTLDLPAHLESIRLDLERLLNTRCSETFSALADRERSLYDYGLPDFSSLSPASGADRARLAEAIRAAVGAFEPRLRDVHVIVDADVAASRQLRCTIYGELVTTELPEPVAFILSAASPRHPFQGEIDV